MGRDRKSGAVLWPSQESDSLGWDCAVSESADQIYFAKQQNFISQFG